MDKIKEVSDLIKDTINDPDSLQSNMKNLKYLHRQLQKHISKFTSKQVNLIKQDIKTNLLEYAKKYTNVENIKRDMVKNNSPDDVKIESTQINKPELFEMSVYDDLVKTIDPNIEDLEESKQRELIKKYQSIRNDIIEGLNKVNDECNNLTSFKPNYDTLHAQIDTLYHLHLKYIYNVSTGIKTPYKCSINGAELQIQSKQTDFMKMAIDSFILNSF